MLGENSILNNRYRLETKIGQGGFARVYLATDMLLKRQVAIKVLRNDLSDDQDFVERFEQEAQQVAALNHPNILGIHDYGFTEDAIYLVMPYVKGSTLQAKIKQEGSIGLAQAGRYLQQMAAALDYAHKRNIIHRDVKPHNMLLQSDTDQIMLSDFGIAKVISAASAFSSTGAVGTPAYMAPEQLRGVLGTATDIYALGCVLFQMLSGTSPYSGNTEQIITSHLLDPVPSIVTRSSGQVPSAVQPIIERALAKQPEVRFRTAGEMAQAFQAVLTEEITGPVIAPTSPFVPNNTTAAAIPPYARPPQWQPEQSPALTPIPGWSPPPLNYGQPQMPTTDWRYNPVLPDRPPVLPNKHKAGGMIALVMALCLVLVTGIAGAGLWIIGTPQIKAPTIVASILPTNTISVPQTNTSRTFVTPLPKPTSVAEEPPPIGKIGDAVSKNDYSVTVNKVEKADKADNFYDADGLEYVFVEVTFVSGGDIDLRTDLFFNEPFLKDRENYIYRYRKLTNNAKSPWLEEQSSRLRTGDKARGWLAFQVRKGATGLVFEMGTGKLYTSSMRFRVALDDTPPTTPKPPSLVVTEGKPGETVGNAGFLMTVNNMEIAEQMASGRSISPQIKATTGKQIVALEITFENIADNMWLVNYSNSSLRDSDGFRYKPAIKREPSIITADLPKGTKVRGWITFEVPKEAKGLVLEYQDSSRVPIPLRVILGN